MPERSIVVVQISSSERANERIEEALMELARTFDSGKTSIRATAGTPPEEVLKAIQILPWPDPR